MIGALLEGIAVIHHTTETREPINNSEFASIRTGQTKLVQKWTRYHALTVARWLADVYGELSQHAVYRQGIDAFFGSWEFFDTYRVGGEFLKTGKIWPLN